MEEIWKDIKDYNGLYQVSNMGRIRGLDRYVETSKGTLLFVKGKILKICYNKRINVYEVHLRKDNKRKCFKIHRLVAEAFINNDDPIKKTTVNHIDGDRSNNKADNLEWCSYSENEKHAYEILNRQKNRASYAKRHCIAINKIEGTEEHYKSIEAASRGTNISVTQIRRIANNECKNERFSFVIEGIND